MNTPQIFNFEQNEVRTVLVNDEPYFVGKDVAEILGYSKSRNAISTHVDEEDKQDAPIQGGLGGKQKMTIINESGLYSLILKSKLPSAKKFKRWVTSEVLPAIRKHGGYLTPEKVEEALLNPDTTKLLKEEVVGDEYLALCWEQDNAKEVADTDMWIKSNPLMELSEQKERLTENKKRLLGEGKAKGSISNVLTKEFNIWVQSSQESYMSEEEWTSAVAPDYIKQTDLTGREIYIGVDLSRVNDLTSISWVIPIREESKFFVDSYSFVANRGGIEAKEKEDKTPYRQYEQAVLTLLILWETAELFIKSVNLVMYSTGLVRMLMPTVLCRLSYNTRTIKQLLKRTIKHMLNWLEIQQ